MSTPETTIPFMQTLVGNPMSQFLNQQNILLLAPEIIILTALLFCIVQVLYKSENDRRDAWWLAASGVVVSLVSLVLQFVNFYPPDAAAGRLDWLNQPVFFGMFQADLFSFLLRFMMVLGTGVVLLFTRRYIESRSPVPGEFYILLLGALLGGMFMSGATDLIMLFVGLETLGISSYIMAGYLRGDVKSIEASLKYLLYGGMSTAILLFGFSLLYGYAQSTNYSVIASAIQHLNGFHLLIPVMVVLILAAFAFKLSAAPFHMWAPDIYEGAPTPVTAFLSVVSKMAGFAMTIRFLYGVLGPLNGLFGVLAILAVASMIIGNVVALTQHNVKRLLAYSTVAHAGYILLGLTVMTPAGIASMIFYLFTYLFMNLGAFASVISFSNLTGTDELSSYAGLIQKRPVLVLAFSFFLLSLAGLPITAGFFAKFFLFQSVAAAGPKYIWLVIVALLNSTISLYYYLNLIRLMVIAEPSEAVAKLPAHSDERPLSPVGIALAVSLIGTLVLGFWADPLMGLSRESVKQISVGIANPQFRYLSFGQ